jgi:iron-sulfur cluster assembly protein
MAELKLISKEMTIGEVVQKFPQVAEVLTKHGLNCVGCGAAYEETIEQGSLGHGMAIEKMNQMLVEAEEVAKESVAGTQGEEILITENAAKKVKEMMQKQEQIPKFLRVNIKEGGCAGKSYSFTFSNEKTSQDVIIEVNDLKVLLNEKSMKALKGARIDYMETLEGSGFKIDNPNATKSCGCGSSFS